MPLRSLYALWTGLRRSRSVRAPPMRRRAGRRSRAACAVRPTVVVDPSVADAWCSTGVAHQERLVLDRYSEQGRAPPRNSSFSVEFVLSAFPIAFPPSSPMKFPAHAHESGAAAFPKSHTCFNQLVLPPYNSPEELVAKMRFAIANASSAFLLS